MHFMHNINLQGDMRFLHKPMLVQKLCIHTGYTGV